MFHRDLLQSFVRIARKERETVYSTIEVRGTPGENGQSQGDGARLRCCKQHQESSADYPGKSLMRLLNLLLFN